MSNIHYAVAIIAALSLLLGLSLGQIYHQHQRIDQLEFNRFRQSNQDHIVHWCSNKHCRHSQFHRAQDAMERARAAAEASRRLREVEVEKRIHEAIRRYNKKLDRWEDEWRSTEHGLIRVEKQ